MQKVKHDQYKNGQIVKGPDDLGFEDYSKIFEFIWNVKSLKSFKQGEESLIDLHCINYYTCCVLYHVRSMNHGWDLGVSGIALIKKS